MAQNQALEKYTYKDVVFVKGQKKDTGLYEIRCMWVGLDGKVHNEYIISTEFVYNEALQGETDYREILYDCYLKFCPDAL